METTILDTDHLVLRRYARRLTQAQLADRLGLTSDHVSRLERGKMQPKLTTFVALCRELGTEPNRLLRWDR